MIDPATLALIGKLIGLGLAVKKGLDSDKLDENDVGALKSFLETGPELAKLWSRGKDSRAAALHLALVTRAFGKALAQYWVSPEMITPDVIDRCLKRASLKIADPNRHLPDEKALALLQALSGDPSGNPYYKALWHAFFSEPVTLRANEPPVSLLGENPRLFDSYFRRAYVESLATAEGQQVQRWCLGLAAEKREVMRHILAEDLAAWGKRHVFGNVRRQAPGDPMPFLSLDDSYVEPNGHYAGNTRPVVELVRALLQEHALVVIKADFGHGKSLTSRRLARDVARDWLESRQLPSESTYPVFIKCARDLRDTRYDHAAVVRSALWHAAEDAVADRPARHDDAFTPPETDRAALFILDGLDEVALTRHQLEDLFKELLAALGPNQRAVVLTRPGALYRERGLPAGMPVVDLLEFNDTQIAGWIERWSILSGKAPIDIVELRTFGIAELARTPILLLMIAMTWEDHLAIASQPSLASLYEGFFRHVARGKYEGDTDEHGPIREASEHLARELQRRQILQGHEPVEAMLWLMSRVAWEAHSLAHEQSPRDLQARHVVALLDAELDADDNPAMLSLIEMSLLLVMQIDPTGATKTILFGHQSFREFLVGRYWKHQISHLIDPATDPDRRDVIEQRLAQAHLLHQEDQSFYLLIDMLHKLDGRLRQDIKEWARQCVETDKIVLTHRPNQIDRRPVLRESALAIGSYVDFGREKGLQLGEWVLRYLCFWYMFDRKSLTVWAPGLRSPGSCLSSVRLTGANLSGADLRGADLREAILIRVNLREANLSKADLRGASLRGANLIDTNLVEANLSGVDLRGADLVRANLAGANLSGASLSGAILGESNLNGANLRGVDLTGADLTDADLSGADLSGSILVNATVSRGQLAAARTEDAHGLDEINEDD